MNKNALDDTRFILFGDGWDIMNLVWPIVLGWIAVTFPITISIAILTTLVILVIVIHLANEYRWLMKRKNGFLNVSGFSDDKVDK